MSWKELAPDVRHFEFEVAGVEAFRFIPGQFVPVIEYLHGKRITQAYSIASPPCGNRFALCLNRVEDGIAAPYLFTLKTGDEVEVGEASGDFTLRETRRRAIFVGTGTGVAPFRSMLLYHLPRTQPEITLLFGVRYERDLLYREEFESLAEQYKSFHFLPAITRPTESWTGRIGRVQAHLDEALAIRTPGEARGVDVYICGSDEMVENVRKELEKRGLAEQQIIYEKYSEPAA